MTIEKILSDLISIRSVTGNTEELHRGIDYVANFLSMRGMYVERFESNGLPSVVASTRTSNHKKPKVMLGAHIDVVPGPDAMFTLTREGDKLHGRGTFDMKFSIATYLKLVDTLQDSLKDYDFGIMITPDEESGGMNGTQMLIEKGFRPEVVILPDAGDTPDGWKLELSAKGTYVTQVTTFGATTHGSRPWNGDNAIYKLIDLLAEIRELFKDQNVNTSSLNIGTFRGGEAGNQVPDKATATLDIRCVTDEEQVKIKGQISAICKKYKADFTEAYPYGSSCHTDLNHPLVKEFVDCINQNVPAGFKESRSTGASDARYLAKAHITCIVASPPGNGYHDPIEWVSEKGLEELHQVLLNYIQRIAKF